MGIRLRLSMIWKILTFKKVSLIYRDKHGYDGYLTTIDYSKEAANVACNMCTYARSEYYRKEMRHGECSHYIEMD